MPVPILKQGPILIASVQAALTDSDAERLRYDLIERVSRYRAQGIIVDVTPIDVIATALSEVARNITRYAGYGAIRVAVQDREGRQALVVRAEDDGPGIADIERAMEDGYSTGRGLGLGLPGARRLMDRLIVESTPGQGTKIEMWKWIPNNG